jgi:oxygen-independent coproporphyrinogen-3 oxidase
VQYDVTSPTRSVYIHWPFCPYKCHYCPFVALASQDSFMPQYHAALTKEIEQFYQAAGRTGPLNTIYFGGGTPSTYPDDLLLDMFGTLRRVFDFNQDTEVTIEVNPGTVLPGKLELWKSLGINRLSIGVQSLNDKALHALNRHQSAQDVFALLDQAKSLFSNISVDVILGLPGVSDQEWKELLHNVVTWPITHVSMYFLTIHEDTPLYFKVKNNKVTIPCDDKMIELYYEARDIFMRNGFEHYEISSFARPGYQSRHNTTYWERVPYKAFGLGACGFDGVKRLQNEKNLMKYMHAVSQAGDCTMFVEELSEQQIHMERVMLGLRRSKGVTWDVINQGLPESKRAQIQSKVEEFKSKGWMRDADGVLTLLPAGLALENEIIVQLCG